MTILLLFTRLATATFFLAFTVTAFCFSVPFLVFGDESPLKIGPR